jgi:hypothetical protein
VDDERGYGFGQRFRVGLSLGGDVGWFVWVASSGLSSGLDQGGRQMLGPNSRRLLGPKHEGMDWGCEGREERMRIVNTDDYCSLGVLSMSYMWSLHCP